MNVFDFSFQRGLQIVESLGRAAKFRWLRVVIPVIYRMLERRRNPLSPDFFEDKDFDRISSQIKIPLLKELIEVSKTELAGLSAQGWVTTVAGIEVLGSDNFVVVARESNAIWTPHSFHKHRILSGSEPTSRLRAVCIKRNGDSLLVTENVLLDGSENRYDPRLFWTRKGLHVLVTTLAPPASSRTWVMATATLETKNMKLSAFTELDSKRCKDSEKNWMPVSQRSEEANIYVYSVSPTQIITTSADRKLTWLTHVNAPRALESARGGSQLVGLSNGTYISIVHHTKFWPLRHYTHRFVVFRRDATGSFTISSYSREFYLDGVHRLEVATGLAISGNFAFVTFGQDERKTFLLRILAREMESLAKEFPYKALVPRKNLKMPR